jgi:hypothetical protein
VAHGLIKTMLEMDMKLSWLMGFLFSYHLAFYPNVGLSLFENWKIIIFWFGQGLVSQYFLLHFFNKQEQENE